MEYRIFIVTIFQGNGTHVISEKQLNNTIWITWMIKNIYRHLYRLGSPISQPDPTEAARPSPITRAKTNEMVKRVSSNNHSSSNVNHSSSSSSRITNVSSSTQTKSRISTTSAPNTSSLQGLSREEKRRRRRASLKYRMAHATRERLRYVYTYTR